MGHNYFSINFAMICSDTTFQIYFGCEIVETATTTTPSLSGQASAFNFLKLKIVLYFLSRSFLHGISINFCQKNTTKKKILVLECRNCLIAYLRVERRTITTVSNRRTNSLRRRQFCFIFKFTRHLSAR